MCFFKLIKEHLFVSELYLDCTNVWYGNGYSMGHIELFPCALQKRLWNG